MRTLMGSGRDPSGAKMAPGSQLGRVHAVAPSDDPRSGPRVPVL